MVTRKKYRVVGKAFTGHLIYKSGIVATSCSSETKSLQVFMLQDSINKPLFTQVYELPTLIKNNFSHFSFNSLIFENDIKGVFPEVFLVSVTLLLLMYGVVLTTSKSQKYPLLVGNVSGLSLLSLFFVLLLLANNPLKHGFLFYNTLFLDSSTFFAKWLVVCGTFFSLLISLDYIKLEGLNSFEFVILYLLSLSSMMFLISSADFLSMYLGIEFQSLCFYVIAALKRDSEFSTEAGLKYFILGAFSSGLLLFGISLIYGFTGTTSFTECSKLFACGGSASEFFSFRGCQLGMIFIIVGFLFKLTAFPFHMWAPDVYEGAPTPVTAFFSIAPKVSVLAIFVRLFLEGFYDFFLSWQKILIFSSIGSMILGALAAMSQNKIKRLLAYSSIGHVGYMLVGLCCGTVEGIQALLIYLVIYLVITVNIFAIVLLPVKRVATLGNSSTEYPSKGVASHGGSSEAETRSPILSEKGRLKYTTDLALMAKTNPLVAFNLTLTMFSIAGIPPLAGFYSKAYLFFAAMSSGQFLLAVVGVVTSVISCFYYIRLVKIMYFETPRNWLSFKRVPKEIGITLGSCLFFLLFFILYPSPLYLLTHKVALVLSF